MLTIPVYNSQTERGKNETKSSHVANGDDCSYARKPIYNAFAKVVWETAVNT